MDLSLPKHTTNIEKRQMDKKPGSPALPPVGDLRRAGEPGFSLPLSKIRVPCAVRRPQKQGKIKRRLDFFARSP